MSSRFSRQNLRSSRGTVITETPVAIGLITAVVTPLLIFATNLAFQLIYQSEVAHIANEAARVCDDNSYWLGLPRPDLERSGGQDAIKKAQDAAVAMCEKVGLAGASATATRETKGDVDVTTVTVNVNAIAKIPFRVAVFGFDMASLFPGNISAKGVSAHARVQPYAVMHMDCPVEPPSHPAGLVFGPGEGPPQNRGVAVLPAYGFWHHVPPDHGRLGPYAALGGFQGTAEIKRSSQFAAFNMSGFTTRNELLRVLKPYRNTGTALDGTLPPATPPAPGEYTTTGFLQSSSYALR